MYLLILLPLGKNLKTQILNLRHTCIDRYKKRKVCMYSAAKRVYPHRSTSQRSL